MRLILASASPRRREILSIAGYTYSVEVSSFPEVSFPNDPVRTVKENALGKAFDVFSSLKDDGAAVLGADTVVVLNGIIIGKPKDEQDAINTLIKLSGNTHTVYTGYAIVSKNGVISGCEESKVTFGVLPLKTIKDYVATGKPLDKAGSYGLQDGFVEIKSFTGSKNNIIGLPIEKIKPILDDLLKNKA